MHLSQGPLHTADHEQVWNILDGILAVRVNTETIIAEVGDTLLIGADLPRQVQAITDARAIVASAAVPKVTTTGAPARPLPWAV